MSHVERRSALNPPIVAARPKSLPLPSILPGHDPVAVTLQFRDKQGCAVMRIVEATLLARSEKVSPLRRFDDMVRELRSANRIEKRQFLAKASGSAGRTIF